MIEKTLIPNTPSTVASWVQLIAQAISSYGLDCHELFSQADIDVDQLKVADSRVPIYKLAKVWKGAVELTGDEAFALAVARNVQPSVFNAMTMAMAHSSTLLEALRRCARFYRVASDGAQPLLDFVGGNLRLSFSVPPENIEVKAEAMEAFMASLVQLLRIMLNSDFSPEAVNFAHPKKNPEPYLEFFSSEVNFDVGVYEVIFNQADTNRRLLFSNPALSVVLDEWMVKYLARFKSEQLSTKVRAYLLDHLIDGEAEQSVVAAHFGMSVRAMQRKLKDEGSSFTVIMDACRLSFSEQFLQEGRLSIIEIAFMLGFSDQSNFTRAFKRWTNKTPQQYRNDHYTMRGDFL